MTACKALMSASFVLGLIAPSILARLRASPPATLTVFGPQEGRRYEHLIAYSPKDTLTDLQRKIKEAYPAATFKEMTYGYDPGADDDNATAILNAHQYQYFQQRANKRQVYNVETN